ncbi:MAG: CdaR family protein [Anaerolineales bacterium]|nr:CdaR family protein [Anaerolineales bacterium]
MINWLRQNFGTLLMAFILALTAWIAAVGQQDPIVEQIFPEQIPIDYRNLKDGLTVVGDIPEFTDVTLRAPESVWRNLTISDLEVYADLSQLEEGARRVTLNFYTNRRAIQKTSIEPSTVTLNIEPLATKTVNIRVSIVGDPAPDYRAEEPVTDLTETTIVGPASRIDQVVSGQVVVDLTDRQRSIDQAFPINFIDTDGNVVIDVNSDDKQVHVSMEITKIENIRRLLVIPVLEGQDELETQGYYRVARISVSPQEVAVFSEEPEALEALPGYLQTLPVNVANRTDDFEERIPLDLPPGFILIGVQSALVQIDIEPIETSITISLPVEIQGVGLGLYGYPSPEMVSLILSGPAELLYSLQPDDVRAVLDVQDLTLGTYQLVPEVIVLPEGLTWESPNPSVIEVIITATPRPTATPSS